MAVHPLRFHRMGHGPSLSPQQWQKRGKSAMRMAVAVFLSHLFCVGSAAAAAPACGAPAAYLEAPPLRATATALMTGRLQVLAVGSASVVGAGASSPAAAWPARLIALLQESHPGLEIGLTIRGARGWTAAEQWLAIAEVLRQRPLDLVIWQAGMTEVVRNLPIDEFAAVLGRGLERLAARGIDVVVMDLQFSRFLRTHADFEPYRDVLRTLSRSHEAAFFPRFDIMGYWAEATIVDVERAPRERRSEAIDRLNDCLADALKAFILDGIEEARR